MSLRIDHTVTSGTFSLDGNTYDVDNNVWVIGDDNECYILDAPHDVDAIVDVVGTRKVLGIICTHAHDDHIRYAPQLAKRTNAPLYLHPDDNELWSLTHPDATPDKELHDGDEFTISGKTIRVIHTPGHAPGSVCLYVPSENVVFTGDTLFNGGPGATGRSYSDYDTIVESIKTKLLTLPDDTKVLTGHGESTTIGDEKARDDFS